MDKKSHRLFIYNWLDNMDTLEKPTKKSYQTFRYSHIYHISKAQSGHRRNLIGSQPEKVLKWSIIMWKCLKFGKIRVWRKIKAPINLTCHQGAVFWRALMKKNNELQKFMSEVILFCCLLFILLQLLKNYVKNWDRFLCIKLVSEDFYLQK